MEFQEHFKMTDGFDLFYRHWRAVGEMKKQIEQLNESLDKIEEMI